MPRKNLVEEKKRKEELKKVIISNHMQLSSGKGTELLQVFVLDTASEAELTIINQYQNFLVIERKETEAKGKK